jgi:GNAT superfamily N-acetyltransferase
MRFDMPSYSSGPLSLEPLRRDDLPAFRSLLDEIVDALDLRDAYTVTDEELLANLFEGQSRTEVLIARYDGEVAGFASWTTGFHLTRGKLVMSFEYIYVRPEHRVQYVGVAMLIYVLVLAKRRNYVRIEGFVQDWNDQTVSLYRSLGAEDVSQTLYKLDLAKVDWAPFQSFLREE